MGELQPKFGELGFVTFARTYARERANGKLETFAEARERVIRACNEQLGCNFQPHEVEELREILTSFKGSVAGRFWWQLGTKTVDQLGLFSLMNCSGTVIDEPIAPFTWAMDALMLGCGVGFNIQREYVYELPKVRSARVIRKDTHDADFIVPDSREGWVELLRRTLEAHFITGKGFSYSTVCIRGAGLPIKGFGGVSSGPEPLCTGISQISDILGARRGKKARPIDCLDVMCAIGAIVVSGNVRRSALLCVGDFDDLQYLAAKRWDLGNIPNYRAMANCSVICNDISKLPEQFWEGYKGNGEPYGLLNMKLMRDVGRTGDTNWPDNNAVISNPCVEVTLENGETCCLGEVFLPNITSKEELCKVVKYLYRITKHSLTLDCHAQITNDVVHKNMRIGLGVTGYLQATEEQRSWLPWAYAFLRNFDKVYSAAHRLPESIKLTCVKPSGTLSLLPGVTPGCHPAYSRRYIRRIRMAATSPLVEICRSHGYDIEFVRGFDGAADYRTVVVSFPVEVPEHTVLAKDMTAIDQLNVVKRLQEEWADNSVSCTIYYRSEELPGIQEYLREDFNHNFKSLSFLLHSEHGFQQAPYEEITEEQYLEMKAKVSPIDVDKVLSEGIDLLDEECISGACPVR